MIPGQKPSTRQIPSENPAVEKYVCSTGFYWILNPKTKTQLGLTSYPKVVGEGRVSKYPNFILSLCVVQSIGNILYHFEDPGHTTAIPGIYFRRNFQENSGNPETLQEMS